MKILVTPIADFIKEGMTKNEIAEDLNDLFIIINEVCAVKSSDYRCYVTPYRELIIQFLTKTATYSQEALRNRIYDDTVMATHGIKEISFFAYGENDHDEIYLQEADQDTDSEIIDLEGYTSENIISYHSATFEDTIESHPFYKALIIDITKIKGLSFSTVAILLNKLSGDEEPYEETSKITLKDKAIIRNTIDIFVEDAPASQQLQEGLFKLIKYLYQDDKLGNIDVNEGTGEKKYKDKLSFLKYFLDSTTTPFSKKTIIVNGRIINIKFYLLICVSYYEFMRLRKMERTDKMRKNKKRHIDYINKVLLGEKETIASPLVIEYLKIQNDKFNPNDISQLDIEELKGLITILKNRPEYYSQNIARVTSVMFGEGHRPLNRFLHLMGFKGIGNSTVV